MRLTRARKQGVNYQTETKRKSSLQQARISAELSIRGSEGGLTHVKDRGELVDAVKRTPHRIKHLTVGAIHFPAESERVKVAVRRADEVAILSLTKRFGGAGGHDSGVDEVVLLRAVGTSASLLVHASSRSTYTLQLGRTVVGDLLEQEQNDEKSEGCDACGEVRDPRQACTVEQVPRASGTAIGG